MLNEVNKFQPDSKWKPSRKNHVNWSNYEVKSSFKKAFSRKQYKKFLPIILNQNNSEITWFKHYSCNIYV